MATPRTPKQVYDSQARETKTLSRNLARVMASFLGLPITARLVNRLAKAIFPTVSSSRERSRKLAQAVYEATKESLGTLGDPIDAPPLRDYELSHLEQAVDKALKVSGNERISARDLESVAKVADMHSRNAYRNQTMAYAIHDEDILGWARVDPVPPTCEFCRLLISRGPVYTSVEKASNKLPSGQNRYHKGCTCIPQIVFRGQRDSWPGREMYLAELERYKNATRGKSGAARRRAWRSAVDKANGGKKY